MTRVRTAVVLVVLACLLVLPASASARSPVDAMVAKANHFRAAHGLRPLRLVGSLDQSAGAYSRWMMNRGYFGHLRQIRASRRFRTLGEIIEIHVGRSAKVGLTFRDWLRSPPHRAVLLYRGFRFVGAGFTEGRFRGFRATIWVMHFGR